MELRQGGELELLSKLNVKPETACRLFQVKTKKNGFAKMIAGHSG